MPPLRGWNIAPTVFPTLCGGTPHLLSFQHCAVEHRTYCLSNIVRWNTAPTVFPTLCGGTPHLLSFQHCAVEHRTYCLSNIVRWDTAPTIVPTLCGGTPHLLHFPISLVFRFLPILSLQHPPFAPALHSSTRFRASRQAPITPPRSCSLESASRVSLLTMLSE